MTAKYYSHRCHPAFMLILILLFPVLLFSQRSKEDSLFQLLSTEQSDTNRVKILWRLADVIYTYKPDTALIYAQEALNLARNTGYLEGESRSLGVMANTFIKLANYPRALEFNIRKLKLEEQRNNPRNMGSVLMNIGAAYIFQEEYHKALEYYYKSDSVINVHNISQLKVYSLINIGDAYDRLNILDSAFLYYSQSLKEARRVHDDYLTGASMTGLGHTFRKQHQYDLSHENYKSAIPYLKAALDDDLLCEVYLGLARLYREFNQPDSAIRYARLSFLIARQDGFLSREMDASKFLADHFRKTGNTDSAFAYLDLVQSLNDSVNSKNRIREAQSITLNEQYRQLELADARRKKERENSQRLQMLFIGIFIPGFFLFTLFLSRVRLHIRLIRLLGILSLLIFFEYLTLFLHPTVAELTHHTPIYEILIFVVIASILIPLHHRAEHWLIHKLLHHRVHQVAVEKNKESESAE